MSYKFKMGMEQFQIKVKFRRLAMKQYGFIDPTYYVASNVFRSLIGFFLFILGRQIKISDSNQGMRPQPWVPGIENRQEMSVLNE